MKSENIKRLVLSAMFLSLGLVLPFLTGQIPKFGNMLLPMHLPVMLCGLICGWHYGLGVGLITPVLRGAIFGMPALYPTAIWMALELATYGFVLGFLYSRIKKKGLVPLIISLLTAMVLGRLVWGLAKAVLLGFDTSAFPLKLFWLEGFVNALPGIALQLVLIPIIMNLVNRISTQRE